VKVALVGQPNSGKSTLFNAVGGYRSLTSNFAGTTVEYTYGQGRVDGTVFELVDLPGLYSLTPTSPVEATSSDFLLAGRWDVIVNVLDASQLARSLELTLELLDLEAPLVVCLNMMDEAARKGMKIDSKALSAALGVPVVEAIGGRGQGIVETFRTAQHQIAHCSRPFIYAAEAEAVVKRLAERISADVSVPASAEPSETTAEANAPSLASVAVAEAATAALSPPPRFQALRWMQSDPHELWQEKPALASAVEQAQAEIARRAGQPADAVISAARHAACLALFERVVRVTRPKTDWREELDRAAMHPIWGYPLLLAVFLGFFRLIFDVGRLVEAPILNAFDTLVALLTQHLDAQSALFAGIKGAVQGTAGAVALVLPYLLPFLVGLAILEDLGYLSRVGYLMDAAMHRLGLHGTATLPMLLGYGCSVPAVMATRILSSRRDRFIAAFLSVLVPCSARMTVIFALVGFYLGPNYALGIYALNILVVAAAGHVLAHIWPEISPGMLMEVPAYRLPSPRVVALKTWWRLREFVLVAFPLLVIGSVILSIVDFLGWQHSINAALSPLTALLGLPRSVGLTLIFGVLRKELSLLMLMQALGTTHVLAVMTAAQVLIFTLFVTFYIPCVATLASMMRELGWKLTVAASGALLTLAIVISLAARGVLAVL